LKDLFPEEDREARISTLFLKRLTCGHRFGRGGGIEDKYSLARRAGSKMNGRKA